MSNVKILVCAHKKDFVKSDEVYMPIHAGKALSDVDLGFQGDDTGDNISAKNPNYCEITVLYWAWKNLKDVDYIGLNHYRRYFNFSRFSLLPIKTCLIEDFKKMKHTTFILDKHLGKYDIILAKPEVYPYSLATDYSVCCYSEDYRLLKKTIQNLAPDYFLSFCDVMEENNRISHYNMFITNRAIFNGFCEWLFPILEEVEKSVNIKDYSILQSRIFGFMAERLLCVYISKNKLKVKYYPIVFLSDDKLELSIYRRSIIYAIKCEIAFLFSRSWKIWKIRL